MDHRTTRRTLLAGAGALLATSALSACSPATPRRVTDPSRSATPVAVPTPTLTPTPTASPTWTAPSITKRPLPAGTVTGLPAGTPGIAWTVDDGASSDVVGAYVRFARETGTRLTFFVNGVRPSWTEHADALR
ncbi:MAG: hypothetical protein V4755_14590, partial [Curtobacterium sp.]